MVVNTPQIISDARTELKECASTRDKMDKRIAELRLLLRTLVRFMPDDANREAVLLEVENAKRKNPSLPEAVHDLLRRNPNGMTSSQIREGLEQSGFDLEDYSQPLAAIMTVLSRLVEQEKVTRSLAKDKSVFYKCPAIPPPPKFYGK